MRRALAILLISGLTSCEILGPDEGRLEVQTDRREYALNSVASVTIRNGTFKELRIHSEGCFWSLEEQTSTGWQVVDGPVCIALLKPRAPRTLKVGEEISFELRVKPAVSVPTGTGHYRYRFSVTEARGTPMDAASNSFVISEDIRNAG